MSRYNQSTDWKWNPTTNATTLICKWLFNYSRLSYYCQNTYKRSNNDSKSSPTTNATSLIRTWLYTRHRLSYKCQYTFNPSLPTVPNTFHCCSSKMCQKAHIMHNIKSHRSKHTYNSSVTWLILEYLHAGMSIPIVLCVPVESKVLICDAVFLFTLIQLSILHFEWQLRMQWRNIFIEQSVWNQFEITIWIKLKQRLYIHKVSSRILQ